MKNDHPKSPKGNNKDSFVGKDLYQVQHYGDKSFPTYRMGRICKIVHGRIALHFGEEFVEKDSFDSVAITSFTPCGG